MKSFAGKKIALVGAGIAGLSAAWHLRQKYPNCEMTLFDEVGLGQGTSGAAPGLLHPYAGFKAVKTPLNERGIRKSLQLLDIASEALGIPVACKTGIIRLAMKDEQEVAFRECAKTHSDVELWELPELKERVPALQPTRPALFIESGVTVNTALYLEGLLKAVACELICRKIQHLDELDTYDLVVVTTGSQTELVTGIELTPVKGQALMLKWPANVPPPFCSVIGKKYLVMCEGNQECLVGATYEHDFTDAKPDIDLAKSWLLPDISASFPFLKEAEVIGGFAGVRGSTKDRLPILKQLSDRVVCLVGFGSKGLLFHALYGQMVLDLI